MQLTFSEREVGKFQDEPAWGIAADNLLTGRRDHCHHRGSAELPPPARPAQTLSD
jgi:hypothetical protein